eukprot:5230057-Pleurochrysis_carterae.AAC.1
MRRPRRSPTRHVSSRSAAQHHAPRPAFRPRSNLDHPAASFRKAAMAVLLAPRLALHIALRFGLSGIAARPSAPTP